MHDGTGSGDRNGEARTPRQARAAPAAAPAGERRERHVLLGVSHPSGDPAQHRVFEVRAAFDEAASGWVARVGEQDRNEQVGAWDGSFAATPFPSPAACLGDAVRQIVAAVDRDADPPG